MKFTVDQVLDRMAEVLLVDRSTISATTAAADLREWDSVTVIELVFMLRRDFEITLPPSQTSTLNSVEAVLSIIRDAGKLA